MKSILCLALLCALGLWADEFQECAAIDKAIATLNDPVRRANVLATDADSSVDFDRLIDLHRKDLRPFRVVIGLHEPWTELTVPRVVSGSIRFIASDVAIVDGASTIRGAVTLVPRVPLLFVMKKAGGSWRISAVRVLTASATQRPIPADWVPRSVIIRPLVP
ncbi:MAG: hypothetical protein ABSG65_16725 [Bryobacteraceae bacterium]|jgi:hypothetical protein